MRDLDAEITKFFNEDEGTFYAPARTYKDSKTRAIGKIISRINHVRQVLIDEGFMEISIKGPEYSSSGILQNSTHSHYTIY